MESRTALKVLAEEIAGLRSKVYGELNHKDWIKEAWSPGSKLSVFKITSAVFCLLICLGLLGEGSLESLVSGLFVLLITLLNLVISGLDSYLRREEIFRRTDR